jgi:hypothetical protein
VVVGTAVVVAGAAYPYYAYPPAYVEQPVTYIEQPTSEPPAGQVLYYCPDSREYYPNVPTCPSPWLKVVP